MKQATKSAVKPKLDVTMAGVHFRSPVGVAAVGGHFGRGSGVEPAEVYAGMLLKHIKAGAGYVYVTGTFVSDETIRRLRERAKIEERHYPRPGGIGLRTMAIDTPQAPYGVEGLYMLCTPFWISAEWAKKADPIREKLMEILLKEKPDDVPIIANTIGFGDLPETYVEGAVRWEELGADMIELNLSCPQPPGMRGAVDDFFNERYPAHFQGLLVGDNPVLAETITRKVAEAVKIPVGVKLSAEIGFPHKLGLVRKIRDAGAKFVQVVNSGVAIAPPDIYHGGRPLWPFSDGNPFCQASGSWLRVACYRDIAAIARFVPGIDIAGAGGLVMPEHCVEAMMLGARLTQLCTGIVEQGRSLIRRSNDFIRDFMAEQGYGSIEEIIGLGQRYIRYNEDVDLRVGEVISVLDEKKCTKCGRCIDNLCTAIYSDHGKISIDVEKCAGCGSCQLTCPEGAFSLALRK
ncbi:MAG: 4Fe-4S binding protein [Chloroflexota bacterium]